MSVATVFSHNEKAICKEMRYGLGRVAALA